MLAHGPGSGVVMETWEETQALANQMIEAMGLSGEVASELREHLPWLVVVGCTRCSR